VKYEPQKETILTNLSIAFVTASAALLIQWGECVIIYGR